MQELDSCNLVRIAAMLGRIAEDYGGRPPDGAVSVQGRTGMLKALHYLHDEFNAVGLIFSIKSIERMIAQAEDDGHISHGDVASFLDDVLQRFEDELSQTLVFRLPPHQARFFGRVDGFGRSVATAFPSAAFDINEAHKCMALQRYNATVYHLMRALEHGLQALASDLGATLDPDETWYKFANACRTEVKKMDKKDRKRYNAALNHLDGVRDAWRNETMHPQGAPYTEEETLRIFNNSADLMQSIADLCTPPEADE